MRFSGIELRWTVSLIALFALSISSGVFAQALRGDALRDSAYLSGLGIVGREIAGEIGCEPNPSGVREVDLFESIDGSVAAALEWRVGDDRSCAAFLVQNGKSARLYRGWDLVEISYESAALTYYAQRDGFARVFERTAPPGYWIRISDVPGDRVLPWSELMVAIPRTYLGYEGHTLHRRPAEASEVIATLRERKIHDSRVHQLIPTGDLSGGWGKFDVIEFSSDFYVMSRAPDAVPTGNRWQGWLRLVNDEGVPEFWFFTRD